MSTPQLERLREHCHQLRLYQGEGGPPSRSPSRAKPGGGVSNDKCG